MPCACSWGWLPDGSRCPTHFCGQPSEREIDQWIMLEDRTLSPRTQWMVCKATAAVGVVGVEARVDGSLVELVRPIRGDVWHADTHLTGRMDRNVVLDWDVIALVEVAPTGEVFIA